MKLRKEDIYKGSLILVNSSYPIRTDYQPELVEVESDYAQIQLEQKTAAVLNGVLQAICANDRILAVSGYRTMEEQQAIYMDSLQENGKEFTEKYVAVPGHSEHQTGLAIDLGLRKREIDFIRPDFPYEGICESFRRRAIRYGFVERYEKGKEEVTGIAHEPWHFRYVGYPHSEIMKEKNMALEEYITYLKKYPYEGTHLIHRRDNKTMELFYVAVEQEALLCLPRQAVYQISGNNIDGCIVVIWSQ